MTESPGWINSTPLIEELTSEALNGYHEGNLYYRDANAPEIDRCRFASLAILSALRRRGLITEQGLELIQREMGE